MKKRMIISQKLISVDWLLEQGVLAVLADLDNTLAGYTGNTPDKGVKGWIDSLRKAGIPLMIVSNAKEVRVAAFCAPLGLPYISRAAKPNPRGLLDAVARLGVSPEKAVMVGDQFFTDMLAARKAGIQGVLIPPHVKGFLFALRRVLETPFIIRGERI